MAFLVLYSLGRETPIGSFAGSPTPDHAGDGAGGASRAPSGRRVHSGQQRRVDNCPRRFDNEIMCIMITDGGDKVCYHGY